MQDACTSSVTHKDARVTFSLEARVVYPITRSLTVLQVTGTAASPPIVWFASAKERAPPQHRPSSNSSLVGRCSRKIKGCHLSHRYLHHSHSSNNSSSQPSLNLEHRRAIQRPSKQPWSTQCESAAPKPSQKVREHLFLLNNQCPILAKFQLRFVKLRMAQI